MTHSLIVDVDGQSLMAESRRMLKYLRERARALTKSELVERMRKAAQELEEVVATINEADIRRVPFPGKWHIADVVDHISQTQIRGAEELRHLLAGRRPPGPPVYEALKSGASDWAPWPSLVAGLKMPIGKWSPSLRQVLSEWSHRMTISTCIEPLYRQHVRSSLPVASCQMKGSSNRSLWPI